MDDYENDFDNDFDDDFDRPNYYSSTAKSGPVKQPAPKFDQV